MAVTVPGGLGVTLGIADTSSGAYNLESAPTRFLLPHPGETLQRKKTTWQSKALHGSTTLLGKRRVNVLNDANGKFTVDVSLSGMGILLKHLIGSSATPLQQSTTTAYLQQHVPGAYNTVAGMHFCLQKAVPEIPSGTIVPFTYPGCKITEWEFSCKRGEGLTLALTVDAQSEDTTFSYTAATFNTARLFHFGDSNTITFGGTPTTSSGVCTISGGTAPTGLVSALTLKGHRKMNTKRYNFGSATKQEPLENDYIEISGEVEIEYATAADYYTASVADTQQPIFVQFKDPTAIAGTYYPYLEWIIPNAVFEDTPVTAQNTDVIVTKAPFTVLDDGTDPIIEFDYMSTDTTL